MFVARWLNNGGFFVIYQNYCIEIHHSWADDENWHTHTHTGEKGSKKVWHSCTQINVLALTQTHTHTLAWERYFNAFEEIQYIHTYILSSAIASLYFIADGLLWYVFILPRCKIPGAIEKVEHSNIYMLEEERREAKFEWLVFHQISCHKTEQQASNGNAEAEGGKEYAPLKCNQNR